MKLGIFTDSHYSSQELTCGKRYNSRSLEKIKEAYGYFEKENCDLVICLGDITDSEDSHEKELENLEAAAAVIALSSIPTICLMGNHDAFAYTEEEFYGIMKGCEPKNFAAEGKNFIFLDANFYKNGVHYQVGGTDWTDTFLPEANKLKAFLDKAEGDCYIFIHQNIDPNIPEDHCLYNRKELTEMITSGGKVKTVFQGHYHYGKDSLIDGVRFLTYPAMCEGEGRRFIVNL